MASDPHAETVISGFTITVEPNEDREGVNVFISKGRHASSLALVEDYGWIECAGAEPINVPPKVQQRARDIGELHGY